MRDWFALLTAGLIGCSYGVAPSIEGLQVGQTVEGDFHLATHRYCCSTKSDGVSSSKASIDFPIAGQRGGGWTWRSLLDVNDHPIYGKSYQFVVDGQDRDILIATSTHGILVQVRDASGWSQATLAPAFPLAALGLFVYDPPEEQIVTAWVGSDGNARFLVDGWLVELDGPVVARAFPVTGSAEQGRDLIVPDDREADGLRVDESRNVSSYVPVHLSCDGAACSWSASGPGLKNVQWSPRQLLRLGDGTALLLSTSSADLGVLKASWAGGALDLVHDAVSSVSAAARPGGGFVVATYDEGNGLSLYVVSADHKIERHVSLGLTASVVGTLQLIVRGEDAHVFTARDAESIFHFTVAIGTGEFSWESFPLPAAM
jgi:hypothetical protein